MKETGVRTHGSAVRIAAKAIHVYDFKVANQNAAGVGGTLRRAVT
jgi:hypothetical protein